jgi:hypothetical protein
MSERGPVDRYRSAVAAGVMGHVDGREVEAVRRRSLHELEVEIANARAGLRALQELRDHVCTWGESDYCGTCGADGRA